MKKHGENVLTLYRQFEKLKLKQCRVEQAIEFLSMCRLYNISPKFVRFKPYNKNLRKTPKYKEYLRQMLFEEYRPQEKLKKKLMITNKSLELKLKNEVNVILWIKIKSHLEQVIKKKTNANKRTS